MADVYWYFEQWEQAKVTEVMLAALREQARVQQGRNPQPSAGIIDSQSVKGADTVGRDSRGYDAGRTTLLSAYLEERAVSLGPLTKVSFT